MTPEWLRWAWAFQISVLLHLILIPSWQQGNWIWRDFMVAGFAIIAAVTCGLHLAQKIDERDART